MAAKNNDKRTVRRVGMDKTSKKIIDDRLDYDDEFDTDDGIDSNIQDDLDYDDDIRLDDDFKKRRYSGDGRDKAGWSTKKKVFVILASVVAALALIIGVKFIVDVTNPASLFQQPSAPSPSPTIAPTATPGGAAPIQSPLPTATPNDEALLLSQADLEFMKNRVNVLLLGIDESTEREKWGSFRTDTMLLVTIDFNTNDVDMISVPRDSYIRIYNASGNALTTSTGAPRLSKANTAFPSGGGANKEGYAYTMMTVSKLLGGIPINYYVGFNMNVVKEVVDAMGGVDYNVDTAVKMNGRELVPGQQHLDGQQVLDYCRQRKGSSDIARVDRQQRMIMAIFSQLKSTGQIVNIPTIYQAVERNLQTNMSFTQISSLALLALQMDIDQLERHTLEGGFLNISAVSYWGLSSSKLQALVKDVFGIDIPRDEAIDISNVKATIEANRAAIAAELALAQQELAKGNDILARYASNLDQGLRAQLESAMEQVEKAIDQEDKALLDVATPSLATINQTILSILEPQTNVPQPLPPTGDVVFPSPSDNGGFNQGGQFDGGQFSNGFNQ